MIVRYTIITQFVKTEENCNEHKRSKNHAQIEAFPGIISPDDPIVINYH